MIPNHGDATNDLVQDACQNASMHDARVALMLFIDDCLTTNSIDAIIVKGEFKACFVPTATDKTLLSVWLFVYTIFYCFQFSIAPDLLLLKEV